MECFTIYSNEIEGRIDPFYYRPEFRELEKKIIDCKFGYLRFRDIIHDISGGATPKVDENYYSDEGIPFLRVQNITEEGINLEDVKFIKKEIHEKMLKRSQLHEGELVFTITGRIGNVAVVPKSFIGNINQHSVRIKLKEEINGIKIIPEYIALFFNTTIGQKLSFRKTTGGTRPALDYDAIKTLILPLPNFEKQKQIMEKIKQAYQSKKSKEAEAQKLLDSINDYVLDELGIKMPELKDKMVYVVNSDDVEGKRIDAYYYQPKFEEVEKILKEGKYKIIPLKEITDKSANNKIKIENNKRYIYVEIGDINKKEGTINLKEELLGKNLPKGPKKRLFKEDIIISMVRPYLKGIAKIRQKLYNLISTSAFCVLRPKEEINSEYLFSFVRTDLFIIMFSKFMTGSTYPTISKDDIFKLWVPLPPLSVQNKIADEVRRRMQKAEQLQKEAKEDLEKAKQEVEKIILG